MEQIENKQNRRRGLRKFGITVGIAFGALGGLFLLRDKSFYPYFLGLGGLFLLAGILIPAALAPVRKIWMTAASAVGWVMTRVILTILFFVIVTPVALLGRVVLRDPLKLKFKDGADGYWVPKHRTVVDRNEYEKQY